MTKENNVLVQSEMSKSPENYCEPSPHLVSFGAPLSLQTFCALCFQTENLKIILLKAIIQNRMWRKGQQAC